MIQNTRQAALLLHALSAVDRAWLLDQLDPAARTTLVGMLVELKDLGIPADDDIVHRAIVEPAPVVGAASQPAFDMLPLDEMIHLARELAPACLAEALRSEPAVLVAMLLRIANWPWTAALLAQFGVVKRRPVEDLLLSPGNMPEQAARALLALLLTRVQAIAEISAVSTVAMHRVLQPRSVRLMAFLRRAGKPAVTAGRSMSRRESA